MTFKLSSRSASSSSRQSLLGILFDQSLSQGFTTYQAMLCCCVNESSPRLLICCRETITEVVVYVVVLVLAVVGHWRLSESIYFNTTALTHVLLHVRALFGLAIKGLMPGAGRIDKEHGRCWTATATLGLSTTCGKALRRALSVRAIPCPVTHLLALVAPGPGHEVRDAHAVSSIGSIMSRASEASTGACLLQCPAVVKIRARLTAPSTVDPKGSRHLPILSTRLALSFALARLSLSFALAFAEPIFCLEEDPGHVVTQVLNSIHLLNLGRRVLLDNHIGVAGNLIKLQQVLEGLGHVVRGLFPEGQVRLVIVLVPVAMTILLGILPEAPRTLGRLIDRLPKQLADGLLDLREVDGPGRQDLDSLLLVFCEVALTEQKMPQQVAPGRGSEEVQALTLQLTKCRLLGGHDAAQTLIGTGGGL